MSKSAPSDQSRINLLDSPAVGAYLKDIPLAALVFFFHRPIHFVVYVGHYEQDQEVQDGLDCGVCVSPSLLHAAEGNSVCLMVGSFLFHGLECACPL